MVKLIVYLLILQKKTTERNYNFVFSFGAGSIISTVSDLHKWIHSLFKTKQLLTTDEYLTYLIQLDQEDEIWGHQGGLLGYQSILLYDLDQNQAVVILSNLNYDMYSLYHELVELSGKHIKDFQIRAGEAGIEKEFSKALEQYPYIMPVSIAIDLLSENNSDFK